MLLPALWMVTPLNLKALLLSNSPLPKRKVLRYMYCTFCEELYILWGTMHSHVHTKLFPTSSGVASSPGVTWIQGLAPPLQVISLPWVFCKTALLVTNPTCCLDTNIEPKIFMCCLDNGLLWGKLVYWWFVRPLWLLPPGQRANLITPSQLECNNCCWQNKTVYTKVLQNKFYTISITQVLKSTVWFVFSQYSILQWHCASQELCWISYLTVQIMWLCNCIVALAIIVATSCLWCHVWGSPPSFLLGWGPGRGVNIMPA